VAEGNGMRLWIGGPVEPQRGWIIMDSEPEGVDARQIAEGVYLSSSPLVLRRVLESDPQPRARVLAGYAGWGPGQLDDELGESSWLITDVQPDLIFDVAPALMWETALRRMGADPTALQMSRGVH